MLGNLFRLREAALLLGLFSLVGAPVFGQTWTPPKGQGTFFLNYQYTVVGDHLFSDSVIEGVADLGTDSPDLGDITSQTVNLNVDYGFSDRLALTTNLFYVASQYEQGGIGGPENPQLDDGSYHGSLQDGSATLRYNAVRGRVNVTPSLGILTPLRDYDTFGHAAQGRGLTEAQLGVSIGRAFGLGRPRSFLQGGYQYAIVENVGGFGLDRSNLFLEYGRFVGRSVSISVFGTLQETHDGEDWAAELGEHEFHTHDQAADADFTRAGISLLTPIKQVADLYVSAITTLDGENTHDATAVTLGLGWRFRGWFQSGERADASAGSKPSVAQQVN